jgi:L-fucose mutarotase/ribose pyranase (RbsD/FucU family)
MSFKNAKEELKKEVSSTKYFTKSVFTMIQVQRHSDKNFDVSEIAKTDFYTKNGGAYCELLYILAVCDPV